jgi:hypothetical protein
VSAYDVFNPTGRVANISSQTMLGSHANRDITIVNLSIVNFWQVVVVLFNSRYIRVS